MELRNTSSEILKLRAMCKTPLFLAQAGTLSEYITGCTDKCPPSGFRTCAFDSSVLDVMAVRAICSRLFCFDGGVVNFQGNVKFCDSLWCDVLRKVFLYINIVITIAIFSRQVFITILYTERNIRSSIFHQVVQSET